jgi:phage shock protein PspC (stress-responsive transcriptional regulator)
MTPEAATPPSGAPLPDQPGREERLVNGPDDSFSDRTPTEAEPASAPEQGAQPAAATQHTEATMSGTPAAPPRTSTRRLMRSRDHRVIGGVAGGMAEHFDTDPGLIRVLFLVLALFTAGLAAIVYVVLWVITPLEPSDRAAATIEEERGRQGGDGRMGGLVLGLLLVVAGVVWLLQETDAVDVDWGIALAITLIGLGALLVLTLGSIARGALISLGVLLTVGLAFISLVDLDFESSFGDRTEEPATIADLQREYSHAFGSMTLDLRNLDLPDGTTDIKATTSFGSLEVILPPDVPARVEAQTTFGSVDALNSEENGLRADRVVRTEDYDSASRRINLEVVASFGSVEVWR